jgi:DNA polymerase III subunit beta
MKVTLNKPELSLAIARTQGAISDRTLAYIGLKASENQLQVSAADRVLLVFSSIPAQVDKQGLAFVPAKIFSDVVRELPDGMVMLEDADQTLTITAGKNKEFLMKLPKIKEKEWKEPPVVESQNFADLPSEKLYYMIDQVQFCVAHESPRNYGSVGFFHKTDASRLRLVGTDGFRLSYSEIEITLPKAFLDSGVCLSKRALSEMQRMCAEGFPTVRVAISDDNTTLMASAPDYSIFVRLSAVKYPNYQGVLPKNSLTPIKISRPHLQSVAKRVLLAADKSRALQMHFANSVLTLRSRTQGTSEGMESIPLHDYSGGERDLAINGKFLTDVFSTITSEEVTLNIKSEDDPIVLIPKEEPQNCHSMHVLVPIREA